MVVQDESAGRHTVDSGGDAAKTLLAAAGLAGAFSVASCCALPVALSLVGVGAASLLAIGSFVGPYQHVLFYADVLVLGAACVVMWRQRRRLACTAGAVCARPALDVAGLTAVAAAVGLLVLTFWIEPPI